jgi:topoisomerase-4 subunit B
MAEDNSLLFGTDAVATPLADYNDDNIRTLSGTEHIRLRPGMYIGRLGDGSLAEDGIYVLLKEVIDNSIDEFKMKAGDRIEVNIYRPTPGEPAPSPSRQGRGESISIRDYGRGIPQGKMIEAVSVLNTGGKYDSKAFKKSIGLNGVGVKAVNALSSHFEVHSYRDGQVRKAVFERGKLVGDTTEPTEDENGTYIYFEPDDTLFQHYKFHDDIVETMLRNYTYLNTGLAIMYNGRRILSRRGLEDLLKDRMTSDALYPIIHLQGEDIEIAFTHANQYGEEYYSFVNGQHTTQGGTHQSAFKEHIAKTIKEFFQKNFEYVDIRAGIVAAIALNVEEPMFESQTKIKLGSLTMAPVPATVDADHPMPVSINKYVGDFIKQEVDNYLHKHSDVADVMLQKIQESEKERKAIAGVTKLARERAKKASLHNRKLRDCRIHYSDAKNDLKEESCIFITEGDSASGSITKSRDVNTQAVFSLRGKPLNTFGLTKKVVYENEEFNLLQAALDIEDGLDTLRYNKVIVATDADVDGMHIRLLIITFFLQFFPELIRKGHVYVLQTPLFRVRNKLSKIKRSAQKTHPQPLPAGRGGDTSIDNIDQGNSSLSTGKAKGGASDYVVRYCYSEEERLQAISDLGPDPEITRFKGLGEISPEEFAGFIGPDIRLEQVTLHKTDQVQKLLEYYMGKNTMERQNFIIDNLVIEEDRPEEEEE